MRQLVASWIKAEQYRYGHSLSAAVALMNQTIGSATTTSRVSEWRRGVYVPSTVAVSYMLSQTLPWAIRESACPFTRDQYQMLAALLWQTGVEHGETYTELL